MPQRPAGPGMPTGGRPGGPPMAGRGRPMHPTTPGRIEPTVPVPTTEAGRRDAAKRAREKREVEPQEGLLKTRYSRKSETPLPAINKDITISEGLTVKELADKLGIKTGDIITAINGQPVNSQGDLVRLYTQFGSLANIRAEVRRGGAPMMLSYSIQN